MKFSERQWYTKVRDVIQKESIDDVLKNGLWNVIHVHFLQEIHYSDEYMRDEIVAMKRSIWLNYFNSRLDELGNWTEFKEEFKSYFFNAEWYEIYNFIEFFISKSIQWKVKRLIEIFNNQLTIHLSAYRIVNWKVTEITSEVEISAIEDSLNIGNEYSSVKAHLSRSLELLSDKSNPDYRNSIKESISAVESLACIITWDKKATLWQALRKIEDNHNLHWSLKLAFEKLYWYTSDEDGIRHKLLDEDTLQYEDAIFMLVTCSAFVNLLILKISN